MPIVRQSDTITLIQTINTIDTIYRHDSVFIREVQRGDTIYRDRVEYRDRWRIRQVHDTIRDTQYITQTIDHPPEKYIPKFYKWCTILFFVVCFAFVLIFILKLRIR